MTELVWFRRDLRLVDNPAWSAATRSAATRSAATRSAATRSAAEVVALFVLDPAILGRSPRRDALLLGHLAALDADLRRRGGALRVRKGRPEDVVPAEAHDAAAVHWNDDAGPSARRRDAAVRQMIGDRCRIHHGLTVHPPGVITTGAGAPHRVFTPFFRAWAVEAWAPWPAPGEAAIADDPGEGVSAVTDLPMEPGAAAAGARLDTWLERVDDYHETRNGLEPGATSALSADLHFGTLDARRVRAEVGEHTPGRAAFVRQLAWRDFCFQALQTFPDAVNAAIRTEYATIRWREDRDGFRAWVDGMTGYPIVDAAMRQLAAEGWMPNRTRMVVASFLVKNLLIDWRLGERYFRRVLVDGDLAQNVINWQWVAGTGLDAAPYFRVFNPVTQGRTHDPDGRYVRRWVPELAALEAPAIHAPWEVGPLELAAAGVTLGVEYPAPIVDHAAARVRTIDAYKRAIAAAGT